ncbi:VIT domain-containing protein [Flindersiella endophytica]
MTTTVTMLDTPPTSAPDDGFGALSTAKGNLPLEKLDVRLSTTGLAIHTELVQTFRNPYDEPLEATYIFPLPDRAAVTSLRMEADDRIVDGVLREREQARADYDRAISEGKRASIAEEERPGVFTMRVGNIVPGEQVSVRLTLAGRLSFEDGTVTVRFPLVVAPRYIPGMPLPGGQVGSGTQPDTDQVPDASRITPPVLLPGFPSPVELSITAEIDPAGLPLADVASSLHPIATEEAGESGRLTVRVHPGERADRDFILRLRLGSDDAVTDSLIVTPDQDQAEDQADGEGAAEGEGTFALTVLPPALAATTRPRDVVFVLDRSGSMGGKKMVAARRATARIVDTLTGADRFAVLAFDNHIETPPDLPDGLVDATDRHRFRAVEHLAGLQARGGTEMLRPLLRAAELLNHTDAERERVLVLVTDGQVGNEDQILREVAAKLPDARIHTVGIDVAVNEAFLRRMATLGGGHYELVENEERLDEAMEAIHRRIGTPLVTGLTVTGDGLELVPDSLTPTPLPALYAGAAVLITGRYRGSASGALTVSGRAAGGETWSQHLVAKQDDSPALGAVWARARLRDLEDRYVTANGGDNLDALEQQIVKTSLRFGVLCRFTAYVAIDSRVVNEGGELRKVTQPVDLPQGWDPNALAGGYGGGYGAAPAPMMQAASFGGATRGMAAPSGMPPGGGVQTFARAAGGIVGGVRRKLSGHDDSLELDVVPPELRTTATTYLRKLAEATAEQRPAVLAELRADLEALASKLTQAGVDALTLRPIQQLVSDLAAYERIPAPTAADTERLLTRSTDVLTPFADAPVRGGPNPGEATPGAGGVSASGRPAPERKRFWSR